MNANEKEPQGINDLEQVDWWIKEKYPLRGNRTGEFLRSLATEVRLLRLANRQLEEKVYHTPPGQLEYAPEGWTWRQQSRATHDRLTELEAECIDQSGRVAHLYQVVSLLREEVRQARIQIVREDHPDGGSVADFYNLNTHSTQADDCNYAAARAAVDDAKAITDPVLP